MRVMRYYVVRIHINIIIRKATISYMRGDVLQIEIEANV